MWLLVIWMYATYVKWCIIQYAFKVDTHTHTQFRSCNYWIADDGRTLQTYLAGLLTMPRAMADAGLISGLALMGLATQHPPVSCEKCQSCYNACGEGQHPLVSNLRSSVELGLAIVRYSGLSKSLYHASGEALEGWLSRILALLELSWPAPPHPLLETGKARDILTLTGKLCNFWKLSSNTCPPYCSSLTRFFGWVW